MKNGKLPLSDGHNLFGGYLRSHEAYRVGLLPELPEALQRPDDAPALDVQ
jgi:hypothetical protein